MTVRPPARASRFRRLGAVFGLASVAVVGVSQADGPVVHVHFDPDPAEDLRWGARAAQGRLPAALDTSSGPVPAPGEASLGATVYGGASAGQGVDAAYQIDRLTTQPDVVRYDDPFSPSVAPFKRLFAFDKVGENLELAVAETRLAPVAVGGSALAGEDAFFGDVQVDLVRGQPMRIPSVAAGARLLALHADPAVEVTIHQDGAGNWFAVGDATTRVRLLMQLSVSRGVFAGRFPPVGWAELKDRVPPLPVHVQGEADRVLEHLGVSRSLEPAEALARLVSHFRSFAPSAALPAAATTAGLYAELSLSRKGVCRHRSYAFVITAHRLGLPARFVHNEAHAWVEVFDMRVWRRIDLGGAAGRVEYERPAEVPLHRPPGDELPWPTQADPAAALPGILSPGTSPGFPLPSAPVPGADAPDGSSSGRAPDAAPPPGSPPGPAGSAVARSPRAVAERRGAPATDPSEVTLELGHQSIRRGHPLRVMGRLEGQGSTCGFGRVDFALRTPEGRSIALGSLPTDARGVYAGEVVVPLDVPVGEHSIEATSPGAPTCGPSR